MSSPIFIRSLFVEGNLSLFDYYYKNIGKPLTSTLLTVRPHVTHPQIPPANLKHIFDERIFNKGYWTNVEEIENPYLDFEIHYHLFVPTHFRVLFHPSTRPRELKLYCGLYYDSLKEISQILLPDANGIYKTNLNIDSQSYCKFFRYQMIGINVKNMNCFDVYDFDMYGDLYSIRGVAFYTGKKVLSKRIIINLFIIAIIE